jgi:hypothetical protein
MISHIVPRAGHRQGEPYRAASRFDIPVLGTREPDCVWFPHVYGPIVAVHDFPPAGNGVRLPSVFAGKEPS